MASDTPHADPAARLLKIMAELRGEGGCPWDRQQTHRSLIPFLVEETYELIDAIESGEDAPLREELGDVLLQVVFHAQIAAERGAFSFQDVAAAITDKLVNRHPHVFGGDSLDSAEEVHRNWHEAKMKGRASALEGVPAGQPALLWANQISGRAARTGFEWRSVAEILEKAEEELVEIRRALEPAGENGGREALEEELGDLLFAIVNLARWLKLDPEGALRGATRKFIARFRRMEEALHARGEKAGEQGPAQWRALWEEAKAATDS
jgi:tetrapyrrole methylase family protein/MazG family protein